VFSYSMSESEWEKLVNKELLSAKRETVSAWRCYRNGRVSMLPKVNASFGIDSESVIVGKRSISARKLTPLMLEAASRSGRALTRVFCEYPGSNESFRFSTIYDEPSR